MRAGTIRVCFVTLILLAMIGARRASAQTFGQNVLIGKYAYSLSGFDTSLSCSTPGCPVAITGQFTSARNGIKDGTISINEEGQICSAPVSSGAYSVNKDGTGLVNLFFDSLNAKCNSGSLPFSSLQINFTLYKNGKQATIIVSNPTNFVLSGTLSNQKNFP